MSAIAIYGGTFDPVHNGHLHVAILLNQLFEFEQTRFIPCKQPLLKQKAQATAAQRLAMLQLALAPFANFQIDVREIERKTPSFMIETLASLRQDYASSSLNLIIGSDAYNSLPQWHRWQDLLNYAHLIVINRHHYQLMTHPSLQNFITTQAQDLMHKLNGCIYFQQLPPYSASSHDIRAEVAQGKSIESLVPKAVAEYIELNGLYK